MEIRKIKLDEIEKLRTLYNHLDFEEFKRQLINEILNHKKDVYVISKDNELIGEITVFYNLDYIATIKNLRVYLNAFRIKKEFQNQGLGQELLKYVINDLESKGITEFTIGVENDNEIAKHIYEKYDFTEIIDRREEKNNKEIYEYNLLLKKSNDKKIEKLIKKFNLADKVESITQIHGGLSNRMYKVVTDKSNYAIKKLNKSLMQSEESFERILFAEEVSKIAQENDILVERALMLDGNIIHQIDNDYYMIFNWNKGHHIKPEDVNEQICIKIGKLLADIHNIDFSNTSIKKEKNIEIRTINWDYYIEIAKSERKFYSEELEKNKDILYELNKKINEALEYSKDNLIISHRDLIKKNILWNDNIPTIIDWEASGYINPTVELVQLCWNWANGDVGAFDFEKFQIIIKEYLKYVKNYKKEDMEKLIYANFWEAIEWLEYNLKRSLCIENSYRKEEIELAEKEICYLNDEIKYAMLQIESVAKYLNM